MHKGDNHTACLFLAEEGYNHSLFQVSKRKNLHQVTSTTPSRTRFTRKIFLQVAAYHVNSHVCLTTFIFI